MNSEDSWGGRVARPGALSSPSNAKTQPLPEKGGTWGGWGIWPWMENTDHHNIGDWTGRISYSSMHQFNVHGVLGSAGWVCVSEMDGGREGLGLSSAWWSSAPGDKSCRRTRPKTLEPPAGVDDEVISQRTGSPSPCPARLSRGACPISKQKEAILSTPNLAPQRELDRSILHHQCQAGLRDCTTENTCWDILLKESTPSSHHGSPTQSDPHLGGHNVMALSTQQLRVDKTVNSHAQH